MEGVDCMFNVFHTTVAHFDSVPVTYFIECFRKFKLVAKPYRLMSVLSTHAVIISTWSIKHRCCEGVPLCQSSVNPMSSLS